MNNNNKIFKYIHLFVLKFKTPRGVGKSIGKYSENVKKVFFQYNLY